jgi:LPXTG-motif cell wall-anchored protein
VFYPRRMPGWLRILVVAGALLALLPSAAAAQSAGDEQYSDPFAGDKDQTQAQATPAPTAAPAPAAQPTQAPTTPAPAAQTQPAPTAAQPQLPRTGADARLPALLGLALLSAGLALRAHARRTP